RRRRTAPAGRPPASDPPAYRSRGRRCRPRARALDRRTRSACPTESQGAWTRPRRGPGSARDPARGSLLVLRRQSSDHRVVLVEHAHLGGTTGRTAVVEEVDVGVVVVLPLLRRVVLVEDGL